MLSLKPQHMRGKVDDKQERKSPEINLKFSAKVGGGERD